MNEVKNESLAAMITANIISGAAATATSPHIDNKVLTDLHKSRLPSPGDLSVLTDTLTAMNVPSDLKLGKNDPSLLPSASLGPEPGTKKIG